MINVIGLGYIGLPTALMLSASGNEVIGTDINNEIVDMLNKGKLPIEEKGLPELYQNALNKGVKFSSEYITTDTYIITVPTPYIKDNKKIDPQYIISAVKRILEIINQDITIVIESTVSPGTIDKYIRPIIDDFQVDNSNYKIDLVHAPERILPGNMIYELKNNSRTIGCDEPKSGLKIKKVYETFCDSEIIITDIRTAEMSKVVENTFRDINIAFANELTKIARHDNLDVYEIIRIANKHPRVNILNPGPGVGGHCISVDPWFLVGDYPEHTDLIKQARIINDGMPAFTLNRVKEIMEENNLKDLEKVGLYGLAYKSDVDDIRESPTLQLLEAQRKSLGAELKTFDPFITKKITENQYFDFENFLNDIDLLIIMVSHSHILAEDNLNKIKDKIILDTQHKIELENVYYL